MIKGLCFAGGVIFGLLLACAACSQSHAYASGPNGAPEATYYGGPPPAGHPEISQAMNELRHARYILQTKTANDYRGHKANAIGYIDNALGELQTCLAIP